MTEAVLGLFESQHRELGMIAKDWRVSQKAQPGVSGKTPDRYRGIARVMAQGPDPLTYQPKTERTCWLFEYSKTQPVKTVEMSGDGLEGDLVLTIGGTEIHVDCQADTEELRAAIVAAGITANDCRANAFPGLWEFDFTGGQWDSEAPSFTCVPFEPEEGDTETPVYAGELSIVDEAWVSVADGDEVATIDTTDWIPFAEGAIVSGAVGSAMWHYQAGWIVTAWQCRAWSFASADPYGGA
jgi:hypothetical protein